MKHSAQFLLSVVLCFLILISTGCSNPTAAPVIVVTASYPGASAQVVADTIAAPLEQQINGVDGMIRIESNSSSDGKYVARIIFEPNIDPMSAEKLVQNRVNLAKPQLPAEAKLNEVTVVIGRPAGDQQQVTIAVIDKQNQGRESLKKCADAVLQQLASTNVIKNPTAFVVDAMQVSVRIDREKCSRLGISVEDVQQTLSADARNMKIDDLRKLTVGDNKVPLTEIVEIHQETGPSAIFRVNLYPAIQITGTAIDGQSGPEAAKKCVELAEAEMQRLQLNGFSVENLSER